MNADPGLLLRTARTAARLSQREVALRAATTQSAISRIEKGHVSPTVETLDRLLAAAGAHLVLTYHVPKE